MPEHQTVKADVADLVLAGREVEPYLHIVEPRVLRRVIKADVQGKIAHTDLAHTFAWTIDAHRASALVSTAELGPHPNVPIAQPPAQGVTEALPLLVLVSEAHLTDDDRADMPSALHQLWRTLFHLRVDAAINRQFASSDVSADLAGAIDAIGQTPFDEIRAVLRHEGLLLPGHDDRDVYREFIAVLLELEQFEPAAVDRYFPSLALRPAPTSDSGKPSPRGQQLVVTDGLVTLDVPQLVAACRPTGAPKRAPRAETLDPLPDPTKADDGVAADTLRAEADAAEEAGNWVRQAIAQKRLQARQTSAASQRGEPQPPNPLASLGAALCERLALDESSPTDWTEALAPLLALAAGPGMSPATRLLLDLQTVALTAAPDGGDDAYKLDLYGWLISFGRQPLRKPVPTAGMTSQIRILRRAAVRLHRRQVPLTATQRRRIESLLTMALKVVKQRLRAALSRELREALEAVGLRPESTLEQVALDKLVAELGDQAIDGGVIHIGHVRDAISGNDLKMTNLDGVRQFIGGDELLKIDRILGQRLLGVYRRGEIYMRLLQRGSSLLFGTWLGRLLTLHAILPAGGAYVLLQGFDHVIMPLVRLGVDTQFHITSTMTLALVTALLYALIHSSRARAGLWSMCKNGWAAVKTVLFQWPKALWMCGPVQAVWNSAPIRLFSRYVLRPAFVGGILWVIVPLAGGATSTNAVTAAVAFVLANIVLNSRFGRRFEEAARDYWGRGWHSVRYRIIPGMVRWTLDTFRAALEHTERALYRVDEYLRFRSSDSKVVRIIKAATGVVWAAVAYVVRFYVNLLIEPQVNPIKHFPVVTVAHKLMIPALPELTRILMTATEPILGKVIGASFAVSTIFLLPGIAGFLVWELKENWKLYRQNRRPTLPPSIVGHHSETVARLMRPGFHSGTLPKLFARMRRHRHSLRPGALRRARHGLADVEHALKHFVEREFLAILRHSGVCGGKDALNLNVATIRLASNIIRIDIARPATENNGEGSAPIALLFEEQSGSLVADVDAGPQSWLASVSPRQHAFLELALTGLYKRAGVDLVRLQIARHVGDVQSYDIADEGLVVWPGPGYERRQVWTVPKTAEWVFGSRPLYWEDWERWIKAESDPEREAPSAPLGRVLAPPDRSEGTADATL